MMSYILGAERATALLTSEISDQCLAAIKERYPSGPTSLIFEPLVAKSIEPRMYNLIDPKAYDHPPIAVLIGKCEHKNIFGAKRAPPCGCAYEVNETSLTFLRPIFEEYFQHQIYVVGR